MASTDTFHVSVVTPEKAVLEVDARFVAFPAHDGEIGILPHRAPIVCRVGVGVLRAQTATTTHTLFIDGGFAQMVDNRLTILTEQALEPSQLNRAAAQAELAAARALPTTPEHAFETRQRALERARVKLRLTAA